MKAKKLICLATAAVMAASIAVVFAGCGEDSNKVSVEWMTSAREVLKTDKVTKGDKVKDWTPSADQTPDGKAFGGWYEEASYSTKFNFDTAINEDTRIYAQWLSTTVETDTRMWYIMGNNAGDLKDNNYTFATVPTTDDDGKVILDDNGYATFTVADGMDKYLLTKAADKNDYSIEVTLYKGATFQMATNITTKDWTGDAGFARASFGNIEGAEWDEDATSATGLSSTKGHVNDEKGRTIFTTTKEYGDDWCQWPTTCAINAKFKLTIHTFPGEDAIRNTISWEIIEDYGEIEVEDTIHIMGGFNGWAEKDEYKLAVDATGKEFTGYLNVPAEGAGMKLKSSFGEWLAPTTYKDVDGETVVDIEIPEEGDDKGNAVLPEGYYKFTVTFNDEEKMEIEVEKLDQKVLDYYVVGTFEDLNFANGTILRRMHYINAATVAYTFEVKDATTQDQYNWIQGGIFAARIVSATANKVPNNDSVAWIGAGNEILAEEGIYTATYNLATGVVKFEKVGALGDDITLDGLVDPDTYEVDETPLNYYVVGTFADVNYADAPVSAEHKMTKVDDNTYTFELVVTDMTEKYPYLTEKGEGVIFGIQVIAAEEGVAEVSNKAGTAKWITNGGDYYIAEAGTYTVTFDLTTKKITLVKK